MEKYKKDDKVYYLRSDNQSEHNRVASFANPYGSNR